MCATWLMASGLPERSQNNTVTPMSSHAAITKGAYEYGEVSAKMKESPGIPVIPATLKKPGISSGAPMMGTTTWNRIAGPKGCDGSARNRVLLPLDSPSPGRPSQGPTKPIEV
jgi:hypothetical protein